MDKDYRRCISCRRVAHRSEFLRIVRCRPDREITIDRGNSWIQGRSAYLCQNVECLQSAQKKNRLSKALKAKVDNEIYQQLQ
jgi:uncharacterized protein